jgi:uncharacterized protein YciI
VPTFIYIGHDGPDKSDLRQRQRPDHLAKIEALDAAGRIRFAGPLRDEGGQPRGSVIVFEADDLTAARAVAESDPYAEAGVFERLEVWETLAVFPKPGA